MGVSLVDTGSRKVLAHRTARPKSPPATKQAATQPRPDPAVAHNTSQQRDLAALRRLTMRLAAGLDRIAKGPQPEAAKKDDEKHHTKEKPVVAKTFADDRLLGKTDGVIDGLNILTQIVVRLVEKERQCVVTTSASGGPFNGKPGHDGQGLATRIAAELDRIAARAGSPEIPEEDGAQL